MTTPTPQPAWAGPVQALRTAIDHLCADLQHTPVDQQFTALNALTTTFNQAHTTARIHAITTARTQGWALRRIATAAECSHEQIRVLLLDQP